MKYKAPTYKQQLFCHEYLVDCNGARAYQMIYKSCRSYAAARQGAYRLLNLPQVKQYLKEIREDLQKQVGVSKLMVAMELKKIAFCTVSDYMDDWGKLKEWEQVTDDTKDALIIETIIVKGAKKVRVKPHDKIKALLMLCKMFGWDVRSQKKEASNFKGRLIIQFGSEDQEKTNC